MRSKNPDTHVIPTDTIYMTIDKDAVRRSGMMHPGDSIPDRMVISLQGKQALYKGDLMMLEMIANCNWTRPLYVAITVGGENFMNLGDNFVQEGLANRITPFTTTRGNNYDAAKSYDVMMNKFKWGNLSRPGLYLDETTMRMCYTHRREMAHLAIELLNKHEDAKALKVLQKSEKEIPYYNVPISLQGGSAEMARAYAVLGKKAKAMEIFNALWKNSSQYVAYYLGLNGKFFDMSQFNCKFHIQYLGSILQEVDSIDRTWANTHAKQLEASPVHSRHGAAASESKNRLHRSLPSGEGNNFQKGKNRPSSAALPAVSAPA